MTADKDETHATQPSRCIWLICGWCFPCFAFSFLLVLLFLTIVFFWFEIPLGVQPITVGESFSAIYHSALLPIFGLIGDILRGLSPWGVIVFTLLVVILWGPSWIREVLTSSKWEFPGGWKFDGSTAAFRKELNETARIVDRANKEIDEAYEAAREFASRLRDSHNIDACVSDVTKDIVKLIGERCPDDFRLTLYVPDLIFSDRLFQLTQYFERSGRKNPKSKTGRAFSVRYGVIGRVWRSGVDEVEGDLISSDDRRQLGVNYTQADLEQFIARRWGLSLAEAVHVSAYNSYGAIKLIRANRELGVLFFDSKMTNAFCEPDERRNLEKELGSLLKGAPLLVRLLELSNEVATWSGRIQITRNS